MVGTVNYTTLGYHKLQSEGYVSGPARGDMMASVLQRWKEGHVSLVLWPCFCRGLVCGVFIDGTWTASVQSDSDHKMPPTVWVQTRISVGRG